MVAGATCMGAVPTVRRMPVMTERTAVWRVGLSYPACWCATLIAPRRRLMVEGL